MRPTPTALLRSRFTLTPWRRRLPRNHLAAWNACERYSKRRTLTIGPQLGLTFTPDEEFQARNSRVFKALDFALTGHPEAEKVDRSIKKLIGSINGTIGALAELSNIPGLRHGGSLDWSTLQRQHALMLGGLRDTLVSFLFDVAWSRAVAKVENKEDRYEDFEAFNTSLDYEFGTFEVAGSTFPASRILFKLDPIQYDTAREEWAAEQAFPVDDEEAAA